MRTSTRRTFLAAMPLLVAAAGRARAQDAEAAPAACTLAATERATRERGMRCPECNSYAVVPAGVERYTCCHCRRSGGYGRFVSVHRR